MKVPNLAKTLVLPRFAPATSQLLVSTQLQYYFRTSRALSMPQLEDGSTTSDLASSRSGGDPLVRRAVSSIHHKDSSSYVKYFYVFVALVVVILVGTLSLFFRRRERRKVQRRESRHTALAQDLTGWPSGRSWWTRERLTGRRVRRDALEGLDERGEAPPPYKRAPEDPGGDHTHGSHGEGPRSEDVTVPPPAFVAREEGQKPPSYEEVRRPSNALAGHFGVNGG
ncbi:MAG: hypothetical protein M1831_005630 [Alyxoria varia]|nr:MAG: hypothetical protein M1831_005630 [Alyxoria varia]